MYVRRYIADFVQERMLGLPSFVLTKTIVQWLSLIGLDVSKNLKENPNTLENLCKKVEFLRKLILRIHVILHYQMNSLVVDAPYFIGCVSFQTVDQNIRQELFSATVLSQANDLTGSFNTAWRKHDFARFVFSCLFTGCSLS